MAELYEYMSYFMEKLIGKDVIEITEDTIILTDGTQLYIEPNEGGCSCGSGDSCFDMPPIRLDKPAKIMNIKVEDTEDDDGEYYEKIFILFNNAKINESIDFYPNSGNGYYGQGVWVTIRKGESK